MNGLSSKASSFLKAYLLFCNGRKTKCTLQFCCSIQRSYVVCSWNLLQKRNFCKTSESHITFDNPDVQNYISAVVEEYNILKGKENNQETLGTHERIAELSSIVELINARKALLADADELKSMKEGSSDVELEDMVREEMSLYQQKMKEIDDKILENLVPADPQESLGAVLEVSAGVGGKEAMLFSRELFDMYCNYASFRGWSVDLALMDLNEMGGLRHSSALISGQGYVFGLLSNEAGVHRVQRIPVTERSGRMHTSTVKVAVLPQPSELDVDIKKDDLKIETKRAGGAGGQHVNTTDSAVRITHLPSGLAVECQTERSQHRNKELAMQRLRAKLFEAEKKKRDETEATSRKEQIGDAARSEKIRTYNFSQMAELIKVQPMKKQRRDFFCWEKSNSHSYQLSTFNTMRIEMDRITDHRIGYTEHGLEEFLQGKESLDRLITSLHKKLKEERLIRVLKSVR